MEIAADNPALSVLPDLVEPADLDRANGRIATAQLVADEFVGPPFGGFLFALAGAASIRTQQLLLGLAVTGGLASVAYMMTFSIIVLYATQTLGVDSTGYGVILAVSSLGGLLASFSAAKMRAALGYRLVIPGALALGAITMTGLFFTTSPYVAAVLLAAYIFHVTVWNICAVSLRQRLVPADMRGRQNSLFKLSGLVGLVIGAGIAGPIANAADLAAPFGIAGLIFGVCVVYTAWLLRIEPDMSVA